MINFFISRPVAIIMAFLAFFILGIITYLNIPVSLLPDIAIPEITVQISGGNTSARELENTVVAPIRRQLLQTGKLRDIRTETRDGNAIIRLYFEYGASTDLSFIEVNEKIDAAMNSIPREIDRPRVIKASATDIPVFNLNLTLKKDQAFEAANEEDFLNLCEFAETVIRRRIEQLPEVAMVDMTGLVKKEVAIIPDNNLLEISGISLADIESALNNNNIEPGSMIVRDGYYEYNIKFSSVLRTLEDIRNIFLIKNDKILQLKDLAKVEMVSQQEKGSVFYNGKRAIVLAIIKQTDENMANMQEALEKVTRRFQKDYPDIAFDTSQNQTELLDYTISNLQENLILAFILVWLVSVFSMRDARSPLIIGLTTFVALVISLLFFYLFHVSLNVVSLTGLVLALGTMIDSSIIVSDNIGQYRMRGLTLHEACVKGTNEVIVPILSSFMTNIAVFLPLVFLSGIAGAIFFDQAFSVTVGLLVSYVTGIALLPVLYKVLFSMKTPGWLKRAAGKVFSLLDRKKKSEGEKRESWTERIYHKGINWTFRHQAFVTVIMIIVFPVCFFFFLIIPKEKMPDISQNELLAFIEWNENIHVKENRERCLQLVQHLGDQLLESSAMVGQQQFLLNRKREQSSSESEIYCKVPAKDDLPDLKTAIEEYLSRKHPEALVRFSPVETIFEKIFVTSEPELVVEYYTKNRSHSPRAEEIRQIESLLEEQTGEKPAGVAFQKQLNLTIDREKLLLYKVSYEEVYRALRTAFKENQFSTLRSYQQYLPIVLADKEQTVTEVINQTLVRASSLNENDNNHRLPLSAFVTVSPAEDIKTIVAGKNGEYIPLEFQETEQAEQLMQSIKEGHREVSGWDIAFSGTFFSNRKMLGELALILIVSVLLMYFILTAQFESFVQPFIVLLEIPIDIMAALGILMLCGHTLNLMSAIGIVVTCGIVITDSILKVDVMNQLRKEGFPLMEAIHEAGRRRLNAILMTTLTSVVCMAPLLFSNDMGSELEKPLAIATIGGMLVGTPVSLFFVPLVYWWIYRKKEKNNVGK